MNRSALLLALLATATAFAIGRWTHAGEDEPPSPRPVTRALHYRIVWADSALDLSHGGGRWVHELFFPDSRLTATVVFEPKTSATDSPTFETGPRVYVGRADKPRTDLVGLSDRPPQPAKEVEVPTALAQAIAAFADLEARYRAEGARLGSQTATTLGLKPLPADHDPKPGEK